MSHLPLPDTFSLIANDNDGKKTVIPSDEFRLGITMAGAASAGCYTGGVMDYLFEILDLWEKAKAGLVPELAAHENLIPKHKVIIDALGGASAGGISATMSAIYALTGNIQPVASISDANSHQNLFYDNWVNMADETKGNKRETFEKLWDTSDLENNQIVSLLNSSFIDTIADRTFNVSGDIMVKTSALAGYISKDLQLLISHCLLRGLPLDVNFETPIALNGRKSVIPNHSTFEHYFVSQFHLNGGIPPNPDQYLFLNPFDSRYANTLNLATKATGAFPVGLRYREFSTDNFSDAYIKTCMKRIVTGKLGTPDPDTENKFVFKYFPKNYASVTIDGGAMNNEPYREVVSLLADKYGETPTDGYPRYGVVMIDPFPDRAQSHKPYKPPRDLVDIIPEILSSLTDQSRIKRREILEADEKKYFRSIIFPRKWNVCTEKEKKIDDEKKQVKEKVKKIPFKYPLASSIGLAFGGLMDKSFRQHDFFLGRNNARNFFRYYFSFPYDEKTSEVHPIHRTWTKEMREIFMVQKDGKTYLPIIPDLNLLINGETGRTFDEFKYDIPSIPVYDPSRLFAMQKLMVRRFVKLFEILLHRNNLPTEKQPLTDQYLKIFYPQTWLTKVTTWLGKTSVKFGVWLFKRRIAKNVSKAIITRLIGELEKAGSLKKIDQTI